MRIQPYKETALRALQLRRRSHHYGLRSRVSQGSPEERRAQVPKRLRSSTALACKRQSPPCKLEALTDGDRQAAVICPRKSKLHHTGSRRVPAQTTSPGDIRKTAGRT